MASNLELLDKKLLNTLQLDFPLDERPYLRVAEKVGTNEADVLQRVKKLKDEKIIRQISAIFDTRSLGYKSSLVAMRVQKHRLLGAAEFINTHPGVSHNYVRNHDFNLWFTIAVPPNSMLGLEKTVNILHEKAQAESTRMLPTLKLFKIGVNLKMTDDGDDSGSKGPAYSEKDRKSALTDLTGKDMACVRELQEDFPVSEAPYQNLCQRLGITASELFEWAAGFRDSGRMRRIAAVLNHRNAGFVVNAMGVWDVPDEKVQEVGSVLASFPEVSHCYQRPRYEDWPYSIFTMVHAKTREDAEKILMKIAEKSGVANFSALYSGKEYKKIRLKYFTDDYLEWEEKHGKTARQ